MHIYESHFTQYQLKVAQLLLTHDDITDEKRRANIVTTMDHLLRFRPVIPIINENDSVAVYELKVGDNDVLSSEVACLIRADLFLLLTSVPGLRSPGAIADSDIVERVDNLEEVLHFANDERGSHSVGGMKSKLQAVGKAVAAGIETIIASGSNPEQLAELVAGRGHCTRFVPSPKA
ncbi:MAG: glutamate 5-kinase [Verrucomicrobiales bacterium]